MRVTRRTTGSIAQRRLRPAPLNLTWRSVKERARSCVYLRAAVEGVARGDFTREEALTWAALALSARLDAVIALAVEERVNRWRHR
jgi:hypothetical protein